MTPIQVELLLKYIDAKCDVMRAERPLDVKLARDQLILAKSALLDGASDSCPLIDHLVDSNGILRKV